METAVALAAAHAKATVEARYLMALQMPRDQAKAIERLYQACDRPGFAEEAMYRRPVGRKKVGEDWVEEVAEDLSIRFAEEAAVLWRNIMVESTVIDDSDERRVMKVTVTDLEANVTYPFDVTVSKTVERRMLKRGQKFISVRENSFGDTVYRVEATDDEVLMKQAALASKAMRTGVLRLLPADVKEECRKRVERTLTKAADAENIEKLLRAFDGLGVAKDQIEGYLGKPVEQMSPKQYAFLRGVGSAIRDGESTWESVVANQPQTSQRPQRAVKDQGYEPPVKGKEVPAEVIDMAKKPRPQRPLPPDPYVAGETPKDAEGYPYVLDIGGSWRPMNDEEKMDHDRQLDLEIAEREREER